MTPEEQVERKILEQRVFRLELLLSAIYTVLPGFIRSALPPIVHETMEILKKDAAIAVFNNEKKI